MVGIVAILSAQGPKPQGWIALTSTQRDQLSQSDRALLDRLVRRRVVTSESSPDRDGPESGRPPGDSTRLDFGSLPGSVEQRLLREAATTFQLRDPYFLVHEGRGGVETTIDGRRLINFSSYDYLGLNGHPDVQAAAKAAIDRYGVSASASRLVAGERPVHRALEAALANHYEQESCLSFVSGHAANVATISALLGPRDLVVCDALAHNSIVLGAQMSRAARHSFPHNDMAALDTLLASLRGQFERALIVAEGLYSMDGDVCDLPALVEIKQRHQAWLMIDDAHGLGVLGARGRGVFEHFNLDPHCVDIWMGTLSKTLAACGGYIAGPAALIDFLKRSAGGFVYSVAMPPAIAAAALAALEIAEREPERVARLNANGRRFVDAARRAGLDVGATAGAAIAPIITGSSLRAVALSQRLATRSVNVQPIIAPAVAERMARLRFFLSSEHTEEQIDAAVTATAEEYAALTAGSPAAGKPRR